MERNVISDLKADSGGDKVAVSDVAIEVLLFVGVFALLSKGHGLEGVEVTLIAGDSLPDDDDEEEFVELPEIGP